MKPERVFERLDMRQKIAEQLAKVSILRVADEQDLGTPTAPLNQAANPVEVEYPRASIQHYRTGEAA